MEAASDVLMYEDRRYINTLRDAVEEVRAALAAMDECGGKIMHCEMCGMSDTYSQCSGIQIGGGR